MRIPVLFVVAVAVVGACSSQTPSTEPAPRSAPARPNRAQTETVTVRDPELERRVDRLELHLLEKEAQVEQLETRLADTRDEVVRTMAKLQTAASRAEAASGVAEADVALQSLRSTAGSSQLPELAQVTRMVRQSSSEFNKQNFGGALYLATQAKLLANAARARLSSGDRETAREGETVFAIPIRLKATTRGNVRGGPGTSYPVMYSLDQGDEVTAFAYEEDWVRIADDQGRAGWIFRNLVTRP